MDFSAFRNRAGGDAELIVELIELFQMEYQRQLDRVRIAAQEKDAAKLNAAAHALKGTVANFSARPAMNAAAALEEIGNRGDLSGVAGCCYVLEYELERLDAALKTFNSETLKFEGEL